MQGRLNSFQRTMLQWNDQHPYNAVHVVRLASPLNQPLLSRAISSALEAWGVSRWRLNRSSSFYSYEAGQEPCEIRKVTGEGTAWQRLQEEIEVQLNTGFPVSESIVPFRFFSVEDKESSYFGLVYFHACADAECIVRLLRDVVGTYQGELPSKKSINLYPNRRDWSFKPWRLLRLLADLPRGTRQMRKCFRPRYQDPNDQSIRFKLLGLDAEEWAAVQEAAKEVDVTVNDLLLAALMLSVSEQARGRATAKRRKRLAVGSIVNTRRDFAEDDGATFGLRLGSFIVADEVSAGTELLQLAARIREQTRAIKRKRLYLAMPMQLALARFVLGFFSTERRRKFYQKHYPLWAGITNMNLNLLWETSRSPMDYYRGVSTGPVTPLVLSVTTVGDRMNIGLSYRSTVYSEEDIKRIEERFFGVIANLNEPRKVGA